LRASATVLFLIFLLTTTECKEQCLWYAAHVTIYLSKKVCEFHPPLQSQWPLQRTL
jgi:hypothetical protein